MRSLRGECVGRALLVSVLALLCMDAAAELVFRVPEVLVSVRNSSATPVGSLRPPAPVNHSDHQVRYEEYFVEHELSTADARKAAQELNLDYVDPLRTAGCGVCTRRELEYCETRVVYDHCCCDARFLPEPFPWLPHTCYAGARRCRPLAQDCVRYARLRDCCCYKKLAQRWKSILSKTSVSSMSSPLLMMSLVCSLAIIHSYSLTAQRWTKPHGHVI